MANFLRKAVKQKKEYLIRQLAKSGRLDNLKDLSAYTLSDLEKEHRKLSGSVGDRQRNHKHQL
ncbi:MULTISPECIES: hypothetical protein [Bacillus]|uniref:hypothetical protein n=1 Tax=Bacillus TaxID=1386 RepID=UPI0003A85CB9|nr:MULTISPECIES: hypothetical protein [Bacillus]ETB72528.1 hypothetical protein A943_03900 [Bacillus sp. CPSM8]MCY1631398.1 hypothetical protein [Bacillus paralicheniformis]MED1145499.1 hypothetical protein [Bacillus paralicheniformis]MED1189292.1 hypothetical protein [Bacillus paralicheniformis]MED1237816.1 hypothetical protein [Bacillus paralicheniformis]